MVSTQVAAGSWELGSRAPNIARIITLPPLCARAHTTYIGPKRGPTPTPEMHITLPGPTPSPGHPRRSRNLLTASNTCDICTSYVHRVLLLLLLLCVLLYCGSLLLFVIVHLPPEVALHTNSSSINTFSFTNNNTLVHPSAVHSLLCGLGSYLY